MHEHAYGAHASQRLDLYLPEGGAAGQGHWPLVVFVHGGSWLMGDKRDCQVRPWLGLPERGVAVASVNFRLTREAPWPACYEDCRAAFEWLCEHAAEQGLDAGRIAVAGDSSGGHLALMLWAQLGTRLRAAVAWYPVTDFPLYARAVFGSVPTDYEGAAAYRVIKAFAGRDVSDSMDSLLLDASPLRHLRPGLAPVLVQHGTADAMVPHSQSQAFFEQAKAVLGSDHVAFDSLEDAGHLDAAFEAPQNLERIAAFLARHGVGE